MSSDAESRLPNAEPRLRRSLIGILIRTVAGSIFSLYGLLKTLTDYIMIDTCTGSILDRWASVFLTVTRKSATKSTGIVIFTGTEGTNIPAATLLQRSDGLEYQTDSSFNINGGIANVPVTAINGGLNGNAVSAVTLNLATPITGINAEVTVDANGLIGGADIENDDSLRDRLLSILRNPPQGGNANDYIVWAREVAGVTRAWSYPLEGGAGNVAVRFMMDDTYANGIPQAGDVTAVNDYIASLHPASATLNVIAPTPIALNFTINIVPDTADIRAAVQTELSDMILRDSQPAGTILLSHISEAISRATGIDDHTITAPAGNVNHAINEIAVMGNITWN